MKKIFYISFVFILVLCVPALAGTSDGENGSTTKTFTVTKGGTLEVATNGGDILITTWTKNEVTVKVRGIESDDEDSDRLKITQSENTVRVETWGSFEDARFDISIPVQFNVDLHTTAGEVEIRGDINGRVEGSTSAGDIRVRNVTGDVNMRTSGGDVQAGKIDGTATLKTSGGNINVESTSGELDIHTSGGELTIGDVGKSLRAATSGGNISITSVGGKADISTSGGNISAGKISGDASLRTAGGDVELRGANGRVSAKTSGGNVTLENIVGSVEAKTAGGDIDLELTPVGDSSTSRLTSSGGNLRLTLPENAKATVDALIRLRGNGWGHSRLSLEDYSIRSDFKADSYEKDREAKEIRGKYTINGGGQAISLETVDGDIDIRKSKPGK